MRDNIKNINNSNTGLDTIRKERWRITPEAVPTVRRNCSKCKEKREFINSMKFRVNANGKNVDVWTVSYTHLDVYKRQGQHGNAHGCKDPFCAEDIFRLILKAAAEGQIGTDRNHRVKQKLVRLGQLSVGDADGDGKNQGQRSEADGVNGI